MLLSAVLRQQLVDLLKIGSFSEDRKNDIVARVSTLIEQRVIVRLVEQLPDSDTTGFLEALRSENDERVREMLAPFTGQVESILEEEVQKVFSQIKSLI